MPADYEYQALDCYIVASGQYPVIEFVQAPADQGTPSKTFEIDLSSRAQADQNIWATPRGFTSVGDDGSSIQTSGGVWVTAAWRNNLTSAQQSNLNLDPNNKVIYYTSSTRRYMQADVTVRGWSGNVCSFRLNGTDYTVDITAVADVDPPTNGYTTATVGTTGAATLYLSPAYRDRVSISDPKKPSASG